MKGRIYDPVFGRFLTADPEVQDPENSQAPNRYSYCVNNPLRYTDPTGYNFFGDIVHAIGEAFGAIGKLLLQNKQINELMMIGLGALAPTNPWLYALIPATSGATTAANGGNFADIIKATAITAIEEAAFYKAGSVKNAELAMAKTLEDKVSAQIKSAALHGIVGGGINVMQGRNFQDGFLSAAVVDSMSGAIDQIGGGSEDFFPIMQRATASGIVGGTVAAATGGNFWDGFETGAASRLFNDEAHKLEAEHTYANGDELAKAMGPNSEVAAERPLEHTGGHMFSSKLTHSLNLDAAHEEFFYTDEKGDLHSYGYFDKGIQTNRDDHNAEIDRVNQYKFEAIHHNTIISPSDINLPGFTAGNYHAIFPWPHNCQTYAHAEKHYLGQDQ